MQKSILIIDDEESIREAFTLALHPTGHRVETAVGGAEGLRVAAEHRPDLVFVDLNMPEMNGVTVMRRLLSQDPGLRICIITAFFEEFLHELKAAARAGLEFQVCRKPMDATEIRLVVENVLGASSPSREDQ